METVRRMDENLHLKGIDYPSLNYTPSDQLLSLGKFQLTVHSYKCIIHAGQLVMGQVHQNEGHCSQQLKAHT